MTVHYRFSFKEMQAKIPNLKEKDFNRVYAELKKKHGATNDPNVVFNDATKSLEVQYYGEDFMTRFTPLIVDLLSEAGKLDGGVFGTASGRAAQMEAAFMTQEGKDRKEVFLKESRKQMCEAPYQDVGAPPTPPDASKDDLDNLKDMINGQPSGICFGGGHGEAKRNALMDKLLNDPGHGGIDLFFIEEIGVTDQPLVDEFLNSKPGTKMSMALDSRVAPIQGVKEMLEKMRDINATKPSNAKIKAYGINSAEAKSRGGTMGYVDRDIMMNKVVQDVMTKAIKDNPGKKFLAFCGQEHSNTHFIGTPGISQLFGVPAVALDDNGRLQLDPEDKSRRGMPTPKEFAAIDRQASAIDKTGGTFGMKEEDLANRVKQFATVARFETVKDALLKVDAATDAIADLEKVRVLSKNKGTLSDDDEKKLVQQIADKKKELDNAQADAMKILDEYADDYPDILKQKDANDNTLLHYAAGAANGKAVSKIIAKDPSTLDVKNKKGDTPAHLCVKFRPFHDETLRNDLLASQDETLKALMGAGAKLNEQNNEGSTPMHLAARNGNANSVERLILGGADEKIKDNRDWTAYDVCLASTKPNVEKVFYDNHKALPKYVPPKANPSIVDILVQATLSEEKGQEAKIRAMYTKMYADENLRPILELAAVDAQQDRDPPNSGGVRIFLSKTASTGELYGAPSWYPGGAGGFDENANTFLLAGNPQAGTNIEGVLLHEMTHMATRKMYGTETVPYNNPTDEKAYRDAIANDVKNVHLLNDGDPTEARIKDRMSARMNDYVHRGGDKQLLQEFVVGVPQLIAEFGVEVVEKHCPNMLKFYKDFTTKCHDKMTQDPVLQGFHANINNTELDKEINKNPPPLPKAPTGEWIKKDSQNAKELTVDGLMSKIEAEYISRHGELKPLTGTTVPFESGSFKLKKEDEIAFKHKMSRVRTALMANFKAEQFASEINPDAVRSLVAETVLLVEKAKQVDDIDEMVSGNTANWTRDSKIRLVNHKLEQGKTMDPTELAEATLLLAENQALGKLGNGDPNAVVDVDPGKHQALVKSLAGDLAKKMNGLTPDKVKKLMPQLATAIVDNPKSPFSIKKKNQVNDPTHVSVDKKAAKRIWLKKLKTI